MAYLSDEPFTMHDVVSINTECFASLVELGLPVPMISGLLRSKDFVTIFRSRFLNTVSGLLKSISNENVNLLELVRVEFDSDGLPLDAVSRLGKNMPVVLRDRLLRDGISPDIIDDIDQGNDVSMAFGNINIKTLSILISMYLDFGKFYTVKQMSEKWELDRNNLYGTLNSLEKRRVLVVSNDPDRPKIKQYTLTHYGRLCLGFVFERFVRCTEYL